MPQYSFYKIKPGAMPHLLLAAKRITNVERRYGKTQHIEHTVILKMRRQRQVFAPEQSGSCCHKGEAAPLAGIILRKTKGQRLPQC